MTCYRPIPARHAVQDSVTRGSRVVLQYPCGVCIGCQRARQTSWALRIQHEAKCHVAPSSFVTLTYEEPCYPSLNYSDFRGFIRDVRNAYGPTRYFVAGEYGAQNWRPHWHAVLFGLQFSDLTDFGNGLYTSAALSSLWPHGFSSVGSLTDRSALYVAKYTCKSLRKRPRSVVDPDTGELVDLVPEFARMSLKPGLGFGYWLKYRQEVHYARDGVLQAGGKVFPAPRFYDSLLEFTDLDRRNSLRLSRAHSAHVRRADATPERLAVREIVALANSKKGGSL